MADENDGFVMDMDKEGAEDGSVENDGQVEEFLELENGYDGRKIWLVKVPKFLQERWAQVQEAGLHLATMRVYDVQPGETQPKISLLLPPEPGYDTSKLVTEYELSLTPATTDDGDPKRLGFIFKETPKDDHRRVYPKIYSKIHHEASLRPRSGPAYSAMMRDRQARADKPKRTLKLLDEEKEGAGKMAMMASGFVQGGAATGADRTKGKFGGFQPPSKKSLDKATRLPRNELLDLLFSHFDKHEYWRLKGLREKTAQPEIYLKEVMMDIAVAVKSGPYTGYWTLMDVYKQAGKERRRKEEEEESKRLAAASSTTTAHSDSQPSGSNADLGQGQDGLTGSASASDDEDDEDMEEV
ncbi:Transcription initiation factor IIF, small subunit (RAP30) [Phaffia rhodozyma]|uniref:Transcription initiation factor IIF subunit beta n=1 Tax=Phaffia rhodozyma TaxID=264483 RepID=A0A0F7SQK5_PHARH|nr:Transcription initiation factor IIF, small subunit (RAP30) [Phaffia rhodozyma]